MFGNNCGLDFNTDPPTTFISVTEAFEISTSISDSNGNLLAYLSLSRNSDFAILRNSSHDTILNGDSISTWDSFAGGALFIPNPKTYNQYFLFHVGWQGQNNRDASLHYTLIDMSLENGKGLVIEKNTLLFLGHIGEGITATKHANGKDWWLLAREVHQGDSININCTNKFVKYLVTKDGVQGPFFQDIGTPDCYSSWYPSGWLKFSKSGTGLVFGLSTAYWDYSGAFPVWRYFRILDVLKFNRCTGTLYDSKSYTSVAPQIEPYGFEFSPHENLLYVTSGLFSSTSASKGLYQIDLSLPIISSRVKTIWSNNSGENAGQLQLGPDGKIYMAYSDNSSIVSQRDSLFTHLSYINKPDSLGLQCDFKPFSFYLGDSCICRLDLPNIPNYSLIGGESIFNADAGEDKVICLDDTLVKGVFLGTPAVSGVTYSWSPSDSLSSDTISQPFASISTTQVQTTMYILTLTDTTINNSCQSRTDTVWIEVEDCTVGINENESVGIIVYPNPATDNLTIEGLKRTSTFQVYNLFGREVLTTQLDIGKNQVEIKNLTNGIYIYRVTGESKVGKLFIEK